MLFRSISLLQTPRQIILIHDLLRHLIRLELQSPPSTFDDDGGTEPAENAGLVVFAGVEGSHDRVVRVEEVGGAGRAFALAVFGGGEFEAVGAGEAEDVAGEGESMSCRSFG